MEGSNKFTFTVPMAIVVAGVMIAGAIYLSNGNTRQTANVSNTQAIQTFDFTIAPVTEKDYIRGNPNASVVMIEYSDTECPFCKQYHSTVKNLINTLGKDGKFAWVYRNFPILQRHPKAQKEAEALLCAGKLGGQNAFWNYTDKIYEITPANDGLDPKQLPIIAKEVGLDVAAFNACVASGEMAPRVKAESEEASGNGGGGTPYSVLVASKTFDKKEVESFLSQAIVKYKFPADFFIIGNDNQKIGISGSMPEQFLSDLITLLAK
ncbi:MAG TPA: thioredoxin domain-containing protein [Candidatus Nanoarchaeia archaeon]|nr:thioredoxin domain-containing protein [Candidatus Nanoarchaeia archaeon]